MPKDITHWAIATIVKTNIQDKWPNGSRDFEVFPDIFTALIHSLIAQQISTKAVATIWGRMQERFGEVTLQSIAAATVEEIQQCGLSLRKAGYIKSIGETVAQGELNLSELYEPLFTIRLSCIHLPLGAIT